MGKPRGLAWSMRPLVDKTAPNATVDDAVLMNSLLDVAGIVGSSCKLLFHPSWSSIQLVFHLRQAKA
jgi:hypothetical protein